MNKISGVIITYNEERYIEKCLSSLKDVVDEIIIIDSFSTDKTKDICLKYGAIIIEKEFTGFTDQKNFANSKTNFDYILSLDADEALSEELRKEILSTKQKELDKDGYSFNRLNNYCGKWIKHSNWYPDRKIRLFNKQKAKWIGSNNIHEVIALNNTKNEGILKGDLLHWAYDSVTEHYLKINNYTEIAAKNYIKNKNKQVSIFKIFTNPFWKFINNYFLKKGFLDGYYGFVICIFASIGTFLKYIKIREFQQNKKNHENRF